MINNKTQLSKDGQWIARYRSLEYLDNFLLTISDCLNLADLLEKGLSVILADFDLPAGRILLSGAGGKALHTKASVGLSAEFLNHANAAGLGLAGHVAATGKMNLLSILEEDQKTEASVIKKEGLASYAGIPLFFRDELLGVIELYTHTPRLFSPDEQLLLTELGQRFGLAVHNALAYQKVSRRAVRYAAISRIIAVTRQLKPLDILLQDMTKVLVQTLGFDQAWIGLINTSGDFVEGRAMFGQYFHESVQDFGFSCQQEEPTHPAAIALKQRAPVLYPRIEDLPDGDCKSWLLSRSIRSCCFFPIQSGEQLQGVLGVYQVNTDEIEEEDMKTLESVADQAGIAIENVRLYDQVKTSEARYRALIEAVGNSLVILDENDQFLLVNHAFETLSGCQRKTLIRKKSIFDFIQSDKDVQISTVAAINYTAESWESPFRGADGEEKLVYITQTALPGVDRKLMSMIDVTQQRELERRLYRSEELAAIGELSAGIAHEIRNPLVAITTSVSLLRDESNLSEEGQQLLDVVKEESDHLAAIVEDFLKFARPKMPNLMSEDINQVIRDVIKRYRDWNENEVTWVEHYDPGLPEVLIDHHQIQQVLTNLIVNSLDAMDGNGRLIISTSHAERGGERWSVVQVEDSGRGIPLEEQNKIFQPFFSTKEKGTGMGLAICRRIINEHKGDVMVESVPGEGTSFYVYLPIHRSNE